MSLPLPCPRCLLRLRNIRRPPLYSLPHPHPVSPPCPLCLNILHDQTLTQVLSILPTHLKSFSHDSRFKINATFPISTSLVRDRIARLQYPPGPTPVSLREAFKWALCPRILQSHALVYTPEAPLFLDLVFQHPSAQTDLLPVQSQLSPPRKKKRFHHPRQHLRSDSAHGGPPSTVTSASAVMRLLDSMSDDDVRAAFGSTAYPPPVVQQPATLSVAVSVATIWFAGRYNKLSRIVSQTPWFVDAPAAADAQPDQGNAEDEPETTAFGRQKRTAVSVEDVVVAGIKEVLRPEKVTFTAGGREDVDVRMLGQGRPFVVEVVNARLVPSLVTSDVVRKMGAVSEMFGRGVVVLRDFRMVNKAYFGQMRTFETEKRKCYRCVVWTSCEFEKGELEHVLEVDGGVLLKQKTPLRVLHRRTQAVRERRVHELSVVRTVSPQVFVLDVVAAAGTYIKEFVHGDNGRTVPNVAMMLKCDADILQLDVTDIKAEAQKISE